MRFYSINHNTSFVDFKTALFSGLAPDGGLYMPESFPQFTEEEVASLPEKTLSQVGACVLEKWLPDIPQEDIQMITEESLNFPLPLARVGNHSVLELFHGPTMAFKDVAAGVLAQLFRYYLEKENKTMTILVATSGDTGGAIAQAFSGIERVRVVILFPKDRVSMLQEEQLTRVNKNVIPLEIDGNFDDCQAFVKQAFLDKELQRLNLSSANSINIGRLLPQIIYFVWAYVQRNKENLRFIVPSGNMGSVCAGLFAAKMGMPFNTFLIATNENDAVVQYYKTGIYKKKKTVQTLSTAMDIGNPSNFVRILELFRNNHKAFCKTVTTHKVSDSETKKTLVSVYEREKYIMDFHTAVGYAAAETLADSTLHSVILSTASPRKFAAEIGKETGIMIDDSAEIHALQQKPKRVMAVTNTYDAVKAVLQNFT